MSPCTDHGRRGDKHGYSTAKFDGQTTSLHRAVYCRVHHLHLADIRGKVVMHMCDNPRCINPDHLQLGSHKDNSQDMQTKGRGVHQVYQGEANHKAVLTEPQVIEMRYLFDTKQGTARSLAAQYGVSLVTASRVCNRRSWQHVR